MTTSLTDAEIVSFDDELFKKISGEPQCHRGQDPIETRTRTGDAPDGYVEMTTIYRKCQHIVLMSAASAKDFISN